MITIKTIYSQYEAEFDRLVNDSIREGYKPDFSTFHVVSFNSSVFGNMLEGHHRVGGGTGNTIICVREEARS